MEKRTKKKASAVAIATAAIMILAGTMAYLADASGTIRNIFDDEHIRVQINESGITDSTTGANTDKGDKDYTVLPGTSEGKDPTITVDTDTDAYVFAVVKDTINSHTQGGDTEPTRFVNYSIADGWTLLDEGGESSEFGPKTIKKYVDILNEKTTGDLAVNPKDPNTRIYYRIVHGNELTDTDHDVEGHRFTFNLLTNDQISYPTTLTNEDMELLSSITTDENKALIFQTWAIQMEPFCPADEVATADPATDDQKQYAKDAWNETTVVPTSVTVTQAESKTEVKVGSTLQLTATVLPKNAVDKTVTWTSSDDNTATVDSNGVVTGVAKGEVTITATANGTTGVSDTYTVTVASVSYAVQAYSYDSSTNTLNFGPATGVDARTTGGGHLCNSEHCIHNDSWSEIAANPENYQACVTAGCTKAVELTIPSDTTDTIWSEDAATMTTTGDGVGVLFNELKSSARVWSSDKSPSFSGKYADADIQYTLNALLAVFPSDLQNAITEKNITYKVVDTENTMTNAKLYLLNETDLNAAGKDTNAERVAYAKDAAASWWLRDSHRNGYWYASDVSRDGNIAYYDNVVFVGVRVGVAPGFSIAKTN